MVAEIRKTATTTTERKKKTLYRTLFHRQKTVAKK